VQVARGNATAISPVAPHRRRPSFTAGWRRGNIGLADGNTWRQSRIVGIGCAIELAITGPAIS
jgi:hypothetical protein